MAKGKPLQQPTALDVVLERLSIAEPTRLQPEQFHQHLDRCARCAQQPFNLCPVGALLLQRGAA